MSGVLYAAASGIGFGVFQSVTARLWAGSGLILVGALGLIAADA